MEYPDIESSQDDSAWDSKYFDFLLELTDKNASRYEYQTDQLLAERSIEITINDIKIKYWLSRTGCYYSFGNDSFARESWSRIGWRKSLKRSGLPSFFAKSEADLLFELKQA